MVKTAGKFHEMNHTFTVLSVAVKDILVRANLKHKQERLEKKVTENILAI